MKKITVLVIAISAFVLPVFSSAQSFTLNTKVFSRYLGQNGGIFHDSPVIQTDLWAEWNSGVYADIWWSIPADMSNFHDGFANEIDYNLGWAGSAGDFNLDFGLLYIDVSPLVNVYNDFYSPYGEIGKSFDIAGEKIAPYLRIEYYDNADPNKTDDMKGGTWIYLGARHQLKISQSTTISTNARLLHDSGAFGQKTGWLGQAFLTVRNKISPKITLLSDFKFSAPFDSNDPRNPETIVGIGISYSF
ncbi:MAG TPA: hypothetical protein PK367_03595 [Candidatus Paceibacterota bacterium]|nr:hypothetical protein [Candidatus Paceibacterota bacterium]